MTPASASARRARPLLGTFVEVRAGGAPRGELDAAIDRAFEAVAEVHRLMSFHEPESDVSRLNRAVPHEPVAVHPLTYGVLQSSRQFAERSGGCFDITVAAELVDWGLLPAPASPHRPDPRGSWGDVELHPDGTVELLRPVWIDLGGIAKGYAVDRAVERLRASGIAHGCVNAGGDLRVFGPDREPVHLNPDTAPDREWSVIEIENASVASSGGSGIRQHRHRPAGPHVDGRDRRPVGAHVFASVVAERCVVADALTKIVLALADRSEELLREYGATAYLYSAGDGWRTLGANA